MPASARRVLPQVGALVEGPAAYDNLPGRANLSLFDAMGPSGEKRSRKRRVEDALEQVGLADVDSRPVRAYSLGMRQRLGLAGALLRSPRLLVLDEPTNGLDQLCNRIGVLDRGRLVLQDDLNALKRPSGRIFVRTPDVARVRSLLDGQVEQHDDESLLVRMDDAAELNERLVRDGVRIYELAPERRSLEDIVLAATELKPHQIGRA